jgi:two-component system, chemotaxis family, protein-glutamate methylesterase/glutaminase
MLNESKHIKVLIVDDSAFARYNISKYICSDGNIEVTGTSHDGYDAIKKVKSLRPDVVTMDIEMPHLDGLQALEQIMSDCPTPTIMLSSLTSEGAEATIRALELGAVDFFLKPSLTSSENKDLLFNELIKKIKHTSRVNINCLTSNREVIYKKELTDTRSFRQPVITENLDIAKLIIIGSSTGGPRSLYQIIPTIPSNIPAAILIVQHMPPKFTGTMAERLNELSNINIKEAQNGDEILEGHALIAPGGYHMIVGKNKKILITEDKPRSGLRPAVDVTMESAVNIYGRLCTGVILTGMGHDGTEGASLIKAAGGTVLAQDEESCVVFGMPRSVIENGLANKVVPLNEMVKEIIANCTPVQVKVA